MTELAGRRVDQPALGPLYLPNLIAALVASVGVVIGSIGPWATFLALSKGGMDGDGIITLILGVLAAAALFGVFNLGRLSGKRTAMTWLSGFAIIAGAVGIATALVDIIDVRSRSADVFGTKVAPEVGWGLWVLLISSTTLTATAAVVTVVAVPGKSTRRPPATVSGINPQPSFRAGSRVKVVATGDGHHGQVGVVHALLQDDGDGLTVVVKFKGEKEPYAYRRDELRLVQVRAS